MRILLSVSEPQRAKILFQYVSDLGDVHLCAPVDVVATAERIVPRMVVLEFDSAPQMKHAVQTLRASGNLLGAHIVCLVGMESAFKDFYLLGADSVLRSAADLDEIYWNLYSMKRRLDGPKPATVKFGPYEVFPESNEVAFEGRRLTLMPIQVSLLTFFHRYPNRMISREVLRAEVWKDETISMRSIDAQISKLKKSLPALSSFLESVYGKGYIYRPDRETQGGKTG